MSEVKLTDTGPFVERLIFGKRLYLLALFILATFYLGYQASQLRANASFEKMIPTFHPYIANFLQYKDDLRGLGNGIRISIENRQGDIFNAEFLEIVRQINDEVFFIPGVERSALKSIWMPVIRWTEVTENGFDGGPVMPSTYDGSAASLDQLRINLLKSGQVGSLVANDFKSLVIYAPLMDKNPDTGQAIDYKILSDQLEQLVRKKYESGQVKIHIVGFAKVVGDLMEGASQIVLFFAIAFIITMILLYGSTRCIRSTLVPLLCSLVAVVWELGFLNLLGYGLDPYSMLVPFLVFAIAVSHSVQIINGIVHEVIKGANRVMAARLAFRALYIPGMAAVITDGFGFATLMMIDIGVIQQLAVAASVGVAVVIMTNLLLLPVLMSYAGVSIRSVELVAEDEEHHRHPLWHFLSRFTERKFAQIAIVFAIGMLVVGVYVGKDLQVGDLDEGVPELRPDSRYNLDNKFITDNYSASSDIFVVMVKTPPQQCANYQVLEKIDQFQWQLENLTGVQSTISLVDRTKMVISGLSEGSLKWLALTHNQQALNAATIGAPAGFFSARCDMVPVLVFLNDHRADTLSRVANSVQSFADENNNEQHQFLMAAGNAGIEAATNIVISKAQYMMLALVYSVVAILCLIAFRSLRAVLCVLIPLILTSILCQALMTQIGIGVKVATLPVIALGVGIGVDYGIYIFSKLRTLLREGKALGEAYYLTLKITGKAVAFTGVTLAIGVATWSFSPIKFQADMGILLTFMFLWNMLGALILLPALAHYLIKPERPEQTL